MIDLDQVATNVLAFWDQHRIGMVVTLVTTVGGVIVAFRNKLLTPIWRRYQSYRIRSAGKLWRTKGFPSEQPYRRFFRPFFSEAGFDSNRGEVWVRLTLVNAQPGQIAVSWTDLRLSATLAGRPFTALIPPPHGRFIEGCTTQPELLFTTTLAPDQNTALATGLTDRPIQAELQGTWSVRLVDGGDRPIVDCFTFPFWLALTT